MLIDSILINLIVLGIFSGAMLIAAIFFAPQGVRVEAKSFIKQNPYWTIFYVPLVSVAYAIIKIIFNVNSEGFGYLILIPAFLIGIPFYKSHIGKKTRRIRDDLVGTLNDAKGEKGQEKLKDKLTHLVGGDIGSVVRLAKLDIVLLIRLIDSNPDVFGSSGDSRLDPIIENKINKIAVTDKETNKRHLKDIIEENPSFVKLFKERNKEFMGSVIKFISNQDKRVQNHQRLFDPGTNQDKTKQNQQGLFDFESEET